MSSYFNVMAIRGGFVIEFLCNTFVIMHAAQWAPTHCIDLRYYDDKRMDLLWNFSMRCFSQCMLRHELLATALYSVAMAIGGFVVELIYKTFSTEHAAQ